jgi:hypothetical protein
MDRKQFRRAFRGGAVAALIFGIPVSPGWAQSASSAASNAGPAPNSALEERKHNDGGKYPDQKNRQGYLPPIDH